MAVESQDLCLLPSNLINPNGLPASASPDLLVGGGDLRDLQLAGFYDGNAVASMGFSAVQDSRLMPTFCGGAPAAGSGSSGMTRIDLAASAGPSKRQRIGGDGRASFIGDEVASCLLQQQIEIDQLVAQHVERMRVEMATRWSRISRQLVSAAEQRVARRLRAKEEEVERIVKLNWALEDRIRSLCAENQIWRDLAQSSEAAANVLRCNLEQVLLAAAKVNGAGAGDAPCASAASAAEDEASSVFFRDGEERSAAATRLCRCCGHRESAVLLLPCRHLCVCAACSPATSACPICKSNKDGSVVVNLS